MVGQQDEMLELAKARQVHHRFRQRPLARPMCGSRPGRRRARRFWTEGPGAVALRPVGSRNLALMRQLPEALLPVLCARQGNHERNEVVDLRLREGERLDVFVEIGVLQAVALIVVVDDVPQRLL
jgi:hypothetical protein